MKPEEIKDLKADKKYRFYFKNGTVIETLGIYCISFVFDARKSQIKVKNGKVCNVFAYVK